MWDTVSTFNPVQYQEKVMMQTWENGEKPHFGPNIEPLGPNSSRQIVFINLVVGNCSKVSSYVI